MIPVLMMTVIALVSLPALQTSAVLDGEDIKINSFHIPKWVKHTALMYGQDSITQSDFLNMIQFLVAEQIIKMPNNHNNPSQNDNRIDDLVERQDKIITVLTIMNDVNLNNISLSNQRNTIDDEWTEFITMYNKRISELNIEIDLNNKRGVNEQVLDLINAEIIELGAELDKRYQKYVKEINELESQYYYCITCGDILASLVEDNKQG